MPDIVKDPYVALIGAFALAVIVTIYYLWSRSRAEDDTTKTASNPPRS